MLDHEEHKLLTSTPRKGTTVTFSDSEDEAAEFLEALRHAHIVRFATGGFIFLAYFLFLYNVLQTFFGKYGEEAETETAVAG